ncbi:MAG: PAN domain-containing protein [Candidatus Latescibacterota bacterium]
MAYLILFLVIFSVAFNAGNTYAQAGSRMSAMEWGIDRRGSDYNVFNLQASDQPASCQEKCARDPRCMAWTYAQPNTGQGPLPRCWLKQAVPPSGKNPNCVSGYKLR